MFSSLAAATTAAGAKGAEKAVGLPQLNVNDFAPQLIWLGISFVALYFVVSKLILPNVGKVIDERAARIAKDLSEAQRLKSETERAIAGYELAMTEARGRSQKIIGDNRDQLNAEINKERAGVDARIAQTTAEAEKRITVAKTSAMTKVDEIASEAARSIVTQLIGQNATAEEAARALASLPRARA